MKQLVILAGGKGTRLRERLGDLPKPLINISGKPLLEHQILLAKRYGFSNILILVHHNAQKIIEFCNINNNWGLEIQCIDDGTPRGTAGAVLNIFDQLKEDFLVMYGDTMLQVDLDRFQKFHEEIETSAGTLFLHPNDHPYDSDLVLLNQSNEILAFHPYPHPENKYLPNLVNAALYFLRRKTLIPWKNNSASLDFAKNVFPMMLARGYILRGYNSPEYIKDCGTPTRVDKVITDFNSGRIKRAGLNHKQMAVFLDRDGTINREVGHLSHAKELVLLQKVDEAIHKLNQAEYRVCVVTNQPVIARGECTHEEMKQIHNKMETLLGRAGAYVDRIDYCPHHPEGGFPNEVTELKKDCDCRKPNTALIETAISALNIDRNLSWFIGDSTTDILAAQRANLRSILVETGQAGQDFKYSVIPDFTLPDLSSAIDFILNDYIKLVSKLNEIAESIKPQEIIFIGGQSRSGKSLTSAVLRDILKKKNIYCHVLNTDRWLLNEEKRGHNVLERHDVKTLLKLVKSLVKRTDTLTIQLPTYIKKSRRQIINTHELKIEKQDVVIIEGVIALYLASEINNPRKFFLESEETSRKNRLIKEYQNRGEANKADIIYQTRFNEEVPWVEHTANDAIRLNFNC